MKEDKITDFGTLIKTYLVKNHISQQTFSTAMECSASQMSNIINGKKDPEFDFIVRCVKYFNMSCLEIIEFFKIAWSCSKIITIDTKYLYSGIKKDLVDVVTSIVLAPKYDGITSADYCNFQDSVGKITSFIDGKAARKELNAMIMKNEKE
jgi:transcriptional regulator with XRE-family HTH domain